MSPRPVTVTVELDAVRPSAESVLFVLAELTFTSSAPRRVQVERYRLGWPEGELVLKPKDLTVEPGARVQRVVRVDATAGDLDSLLINPERAWVRIERTRE